MGGLWWWRAGLLGCVSLGWACTSFTQEPSAWMTDTETSPAGSTSDPGAGDAPSATAGGAVTTGSPTSDTQGMTVTSGPDSSADTSGSDNVDPTRAASTGGAAESSGSSPGTDGATETDGLDPTDETRGSEEFDACETTSLAEELSACSESYDQEAQMTIQNNCATAPVDVFWVDGFCEEVWIHTIEPGEVGAFASFVTHPFRLRHGDSGALLREVDPLMPGNLDLTVP